MLILLIMIQFSLIDTRPLHGMADVCEKHNIKLLTYGTFVRILVPPPHRLPAHVVPLTTQLLRFRLLLPLLGSVAVFLQMRGLTGLSLIRIRAP
jgi:hypothetical protein